MGIKTTIWFLLIFGLWTLFTNQETSDEPESKQQIFLASPHTTSHPLGPSSSEPEPGDPNHIRILEEQVHTSTYLPRSSNTRWYQTEPLLVTSYIEDYDPEWRDLDYQLEIGPPPESFCEFVRQYDWNIYFCEKMSKRYPG